MMRIFSFRRKKISALKSPATLKYIVLGPGYTQTSDFREFLSETGDLFPTGSDLCGSLYVPEVATGD